MVPPVKMDSKSEPDPFFNGEWLREANFWEKWYKVFYEHGAYLIWYHLILNSKDPLQDDDVRQALRHLYRKCSNLSVCMGNRNGKLWVRRATNPEVDFKVLRGGSIQEVKEKLHMYDYSIDTGPLFCCRLLLEPTDPMTELEVLETGMHHTYNLLLGFPHIFTDGTSNLHILKFFISLLNDVIAKQAINEEPLGLFLSDEKTQDCLEEKKIILENNPQLREQFQEEKEQYASFVPITSKAILPNAPKHNTKNCSKILDCETTSKFLVKCRKEEVTVNSAIAGVINIALIDLLVETGIIRDSYIFKNIHCVNLRRYWKDQMPETLGIHLGFSIEVYKDTPRDAEKDFWTYIRSMHKEISKDLDSDKVLTKQAFEMLDDPELSSMKTTLKEPNNYDCDYVLSNMGNITPLVTSKGEHVRITHILRSSSLLATDIFQISCHTFKNKFGMAIAYKSPFQLEDFVFRLCEKIADKIRRLSL